MDESKNEIIIDAKAPEDAAGKPRSSGASVSGQKKFLVVILSVLCVVIVGLIVAIVVVNLQENKTEPEKESQSDGISQELSEITDGTTVGNVIIDKLETESDYTFEDAKLDFDEELERGDIIRKIYVAIAYSNLLYQYTSNIECSVRDLLSFEADLQDVGDDVKLDFYATLRDLYGKAGDEPQYEYYNNLISELLPEPEVPINPILPEEYE